MGRLASSAPWELAGFLGAVLYLEGPVTHAALTAEFTALRDSWRAHIGRMPRGHEARFLLLVKRHGFHRVLRSMEAVRDSGLRRTAARWGLFLAFFGEAP